MHLDGSRYELEEMLFSRFNEDVDGDAARYNYTSGCPCWHLNAVADQKAMRKRRYLPNSS